MGLFVVRWLFSSLWGRFHRANRETHYQPAPERSEPELFPLPLSPHTPLSLCLPWSVLGFISAEHLFQWLSLPLLSTAVRVKSRALSLDWNHLSHGPRLELISAEARVRVPTPPLTRRAGESSHWTMQMVSTYYTATACQQKSLSIFPFACKCIGNEMREQTEYKYETCLRIARTNVCNCWAIFSTLSLPRVNKMQL